MKPLTLRIVCDICKVQSFSSFDEAQAHQEICQGIQGNKNENNIDASTNANAIIRSSDENNFYKLKNISKRDTNDSLCRQCIQPPNNKKKNSSSKSKPLNGDSTADNDSILSTTFISQSLPPPPPHPPPTSTNRKSDSATNDSEVENTWPEDRLTIPLSMEEDQANLTPKHCFVRQHCLHIFPASSEFIGRKNPKGKPIVLGQIGMGCPYCLKIVARKEIREAVLFPNEISQMYNAALCLLQRHFPCALMPDNHRETFLVLNRDKRRRNISKQYWVQSALKMGLVDAENGMRFKPPVTNSHNNLSLLAACMSPLKPLPSSESGENHHSEEQNATAMDYGPSNIEELPINADTHQQYSDEIIQNPTITVDRIFSTEFEYYFVDELFKCHFIHVDRFGKRHVNIINFPSAVCKKCGARYDGQYFSILFKSFYDQMYYAPVEVKRSILKMKSLHRRNQNNFGLVKIFYARMWQKLHECPGSADSSNLSVSQLSDVDSDNNTATECIPATMIEPI